MKKLLFTIITIVFFITNLMGNEKARIKYCINGVLDEFVGLTCRYENESTVPAILKSGVIIDAGSTTSLSAFKEMKDRGDGRVTINIECPACKNCEKFTFEESCAGVLYKRDKYKKDEGF